MIPDPRWPLVLIIDDQKSSVEYLGPILARAELFVYVARTLDEGLSVALGKTPSLIFIDRKFNGVEGYAIGRKIRSHPSLANVPMYMLSGKAHAPEDTQLARDAGFNDYIEKPMDVDDFTRMIQSLLQQ